MHSNQNDDNKELIKLSPLLLYEIAMDIQVTNKWRELAMNIGFTNEQLVMLEMNSSDRFPAENVIYHWFSKNPKVDTLADHLGTLLLEKSLERLKGIVSQSKYEKVKNEIERNRNNYAKPVINESNHVYQESMPNNFSNYKKMPHVPVSQLSTTSTNSTLDSSTPESGPVEFSFHGPSIPRSLVSNSKTGNTIEDNECDNGSILDPTLALFKQILKDKSMEFCPSEFSQIDSFGRSLQGQFSSNFTIKLRANQFHVRAFYLQKILSSTRDKKKLFNIIWCALNYKLNHFTIFTGYCFYEDYLFLIYPSQKLHTLHDILHRPHNAENKIISAHERINIAVKVGEAVAFLHCSIPFCGFHGQINSHNVLISNNVHLLTGFDKFCTQQPDYLRALEIIKKVNIDFEVSFRKDKIQYLELLCEIWWNVQPSNVPEIDSTLIKDVVSGSITNPKLSYSDWNSGLNEQMRALIQRFSMEGKESGSVSEIVDELSEFLTEQSSSEEPPSYEEIIREKDGTNCL